ncbi:MAG: DUF4265 domain-containing protein [Myxococcaceae bacterium]|nr:DUF4265 domain-containing protein [Myxococcaceae bacterium]
MHMSNSNRVKVHFRIAQDSGGYPPVGVESVWADLAADGGYVLDNVPFFARQATFGDRVSASAGEGGLWFERVLKKSGNSLIRIVFFEKWRVQQVRDALKSLGCDTEWSERHSLVAVNVPSAVPLASVQEYLRERSTRGWLDYEEPILRQ